MRVGVAISDTTSGMFLGQGILLALIHRDKTGLGQWVHTSLLESMLSKLDFQGARYTMNNEIPEQLGNFHPTQVPMGMYESSDGLVNVAASTGKMWVNFCNALAAPDLLNHPDYASGKLRFKNKQQINIDVNKVTRQFSTLELVEKLNAVGVPCGPIHNIGQAFEDEQAQHLAMTRSAPHHTLGDINLVRSPINMSACETPDTFHHAGPAPGQHSSEILHEFGLDDSAIAELIESGAIA